MYATWEAVARVVNGIIPDLSISICDTGEGSVIPDWVTTLGFEDIGIPKETVEWIKSSTTLYYAWHWYGNPSDPQQAVDNALALGESWNLPTFLTEGNTKCVLQSSSQF